MANATWSAATLSKLKDFCIKKIELRPYRRLKFGSSCHLESIVVVMGNLLLCSALLCAQKNGGGLSASKMLDMTLWKRFLTLRTLWHKQLSVLGLEHLTIICFYIVNFNWRDHLVIILFVKISFGSEVFVMAFWAFVIKTLSHLELMSATMLPDSSFFFHPLPFSLDSWCSCPIIMVPTQTFSDSHPISMSPLAFFFACSGTSSFPLAK